MQRSVTHLLILFVISNFFFTAMCSAHGIGQKKQCQMPIIRSPCLFTIFTQNVISKGAISLSDTDLMTFFVLNFSQILNFMIYAPLSTSLLSYQSALFRKHAFTNFIRLFDYLQEGIFSTVVGVCKVTDVYAETSN